MKPTDWLLRRNFRNVCTVLPGIRIPKPLLEQTGLSGEVDISVEANTLVIRPAHQPRADWNAAFESMARRGDDRLLDDVAPILSTWDQDDWQWK
ncbi:MAG: AbrB/MazE/SpoVT family DNA-binding domain-containing protein [Planctomycetes bacterium]|nr:AbrB/MazE/SpoVT family DNA-binding domain-containing protein [Planctomycetota bacterium]